MGEVTSAPQLVSGWRTGTTTDGRGLLKTLMIICQPLRLPQLGGQGTRHSVQIVRSRETKNEISYLCPVLNRDSKKLSEHFSHAPTSGLM